jgi:hypothetical protein
MTGVITGRAGYRELVDPLRVRRRFQLEGGAVVADHRKACLRWPTISTPLGYAARDAQTMITRIDDHAGLCPPRG